MRIYHNDLPTSRECQTLPLGSGKTPKPLPKECVVPDFRKCSFWCLKMRKLSGMSSRTVFRKLVEIVQSFDLLAIKFCPICQVVCLDNDLRFENCLIKFSDDYHHWVHIFTKIDQILSTVFPRSSVLRISFRRSISAIK